MKIGQNIRKYREAKGISLDDFALKMRVGKATIDKYESDEKHPELDHILKMSTVLDIPASELLEQESIVNACGMDREIEQLINEIGTKRAKLILRKAKEFSEDDLLKVLQMLYQLKYEKI